MKNKRLPKYSLFTLTEFKEKVGIPLVLVKKLINLGIIEAEKAMDGTLRIAASEIVKAKEFLKSPYRKTLLFIKT